MSASFAISAGWIAGSGPMRSQRAEPPMTTLRLRHEDEHQQDDRDDEERHRREPQVAIVDAHHPDHREQPEQRPLDLGTDDRERVVGARQVAAHRRRRIDHQDADRGEADDRDEDRVVGLVTFALERAAAALRRRLRGGAACRPGCSLLGAPSGGARQGRREVHRSPPPAARAAARSATACLKARPRAA